MSAIVKTTEQCVYAVRVQDKLEYLAINWSRIHNIDQDIQELSKRYLKNTQLTFINSQHDHV